MGSQKSQVKQISDFAGSLPPPLRTLDFRRQQFLEEKEIEIRAETEKEVKKANDKYIA